MNDADIRRRLQAALGEAAYPPDLPARAAARLREPVEPARTAWVLAVVAAALAVALVATIVLGSNALRHRASVPVSTPSPTTAQVGVSCPAFSQIGGLPFGGVKMFSTTTGWSTGGLRTADGGASWRRTLPSQLFAGMPAAAVGNSLYPPGYADYYLDAAHGWAYRTYSSGKACNASATVFSTSDGGRTWRRSSTTSFGVPSGWDTYLMSLDFVDSQNGWFLIGSGPVQSTDFGRGVAAQAGQLYHTSDGGATWRLIATLFPARVGLAPTKDCPFAFSSLTFSSTSAGWMMLNCQTPSPELIVTTDGGLTWAVRKLPKPTGSVPCPCATQLPQFFDATDGVVQVGGDYNRIDPTKPQPLHILSTSDGGVMWQALPPTPSTGFAFTIDYLNANDWWEVVSAPDWQKGSPTHDWLYRTADGGRTWSLVNDFLPMGYTPPTLIFVDTEHGIAVQDANSVQSSLMGQATQVLSTSDGGKTWKVVATIPQQS